MRVRVPAALALATVLLTPLAASADVPAGPEGPAFYRPPTQLPKSAHGTAIWQAAYDGSMAIPGATNRRFLYTQRGVDESRIASSGFVAVPAGRAPAGGWPVIAWAHGTTGLADRCAPTRADNAEDAAKHGGLLERWVAAGYAVVRTDYEGLGTPGRHPYLVGRSEGRAVLDSVRAARRVVPGLSKDVVLTGPSQGGHATLWAAALAPSYTPGLRVHGAVAIAPPSQLSSLAETMTAIPGPGGLSSTLALFLRGVESARPRFRAKPLLTAAARRVWRQTLHRCKPQLALADSFGSVPSNAVLRPDADLTVVRKVLNRNDARRLRIAVPVLVVQGTADTTVPSGATAQLVGQLRRRGADVVYRTYDGATHQTITEASADDTTAFVASAFGS